MAAQNIATFAPEDVTLVLSTASGSHIVSGYSEDAMISVDFNSPTFENFRSADNITTRVYKSDTSATVTITLNQTSVSNDILSALYENDKKTRDSSGLFGVLIKDNSGRSQSSSTQSWISVKPTVSYSNGMQTREWVIFCHDLQGNIGGNAKMGDDDVNFLSSLGVTVDDRWRSN